MSSLVLPSLVVSFLGASSSWQYEPVTVLDNHAKAGILALITHNDELLFSSSNDDVVRKWCLKTRQCISEINWVYIGSAVSLAIHNDVLYMGFQVPISSYVSSRCHR